MSHFSTIVAQAIRSEMSRQDIKQDELARRLGVGQPAISKVVSGRRPISTAMIARYAAALGCEPFFELRPRQEPPDVLHARVYRDSGSS